MHGINRENVRSPEGSRKFSDLAVASGTERGHRSAVFLCTAPSAATGDFMTNQPPEAAKVPFRIEIEERPPNASDIVAFLCWDPVLARQHARHRLGTHAALIASILVNVGCNMR